MKNEMISIIVPCYNVEDHVARTIESLINQTHSDIEIICVDDGSKDNTYSILKDLAELDERIKVYTKENEGVTKARRYGFEKSNGEYIGFTDADDIVEPHMFEKLLDNMKKYDADISHCGYVVDHLDGSKEYFYNTGRLAQQDRISGIKDLISGSFEPGLWNKLYKHTLLHSLFHSGVMDYSIKMNEDVLMNYFLFKEANSSVLEDVCLYHYVKREGSATVSGFKKSDCWDRVKVKEIIRDDSIGSDYEDTARREYLNKFIHTYNAFLSQNDPELASDKKKIVSLLRENKDDFYLLSKKYKLLANILLFSPNIYSLIYKLFS